MAKRIEKVWKETWDRGEALESGAQAHVHMARPKGSTGEFGYVLKSLKRQPHPPARGRMHKEVAALETLNHPNIVKVVDSNAADFRKLDTDLYLVTKFVVGPNLKEFVEQELPTVDTAASITIALLDTLEYCHGEGVGHRDLKPENIIVMREGDSFRPIVLDFGMSFNSLEDDEQSKVTQIDEQIGNKFLRLPEFDAHSPTNRQDFRTDISLVIGCFYYMLTEHYPRSPLDENNNRPHQREEYVNAVERIGKRAPMIEQILEIGLHNSIELRYESAAMAKERITQIIDVGENGPIEASEQIKVMIDQFENSPKQIFRERANELLELAHNTGAKIVAELQRVDRWNFRINKMVDTSNHTSASLIYVNRGQEELDFVIGFFGEVKADKLNIRTKVAEKDSLVRQLDGRTTAVSIPILSPVAFEETQKGINEFIVQSLKNAMGL